MINKGYIGNSFTYNGKVSFKLKRNGREYSLYTHNEGTKYLWDTVTKALAGQNVSDRVPRYIDFEYVLKEIVDTKEKEVPHSLITEPIPFTGIVWGEMAQEVTSEHNGTLMLTAVITANDKLSVDTSNPSITRLQLTMKSKEGRTLATVSDDSLYDLYNSLTEGTDAVIEWRMIFKNEEVSA